MVFAQVPFAREIRPARLGLELASLRILLTNDDGFQAPGLQTLYRALSGDSSHQVSVVAPEGQKSATGHAITLFEPLFVKEEKLPDGAKGFAVRGTPSDCVKIAIQGELIERPELVISGINRGPNLGTDVFYSGTVSAAMEGVLLGIPSLAVSLASFDFPDFGPAAAFVVDFLNRSPVVSEAGLLNINIPGSPPASWRGIKVTRLGKALYANVFESRVDHHGRRYFWQAGDLLEDETEGTDLHALQQSYISITPLHSDLTDYARLPCLHERIHSSSKSKKWEHNCGCTPL